MVERGDVMSAGDRSGGGVREIGEVAVRTLPWEFHRKGSRAMESRGGSVTPSCGIPPGEPVDDLTKDDRRMPIGRLRVSSGITPSTAFWLDSTTRQSLPFGV